MAEENTNQNGDSSTMKTVGIIVVVLLLVALLFYFIGGDSDSTDTKPSSNEDSVVEVPTTPAVSPAVKAKALVEVAKVKALVMHYQDMLSSQGQQNLMTLIVFLEANPEVVTEPTAPTEPVDSTEPAEPSTEVPQEVQDAYNDLLEEIAELDEDIGIGDVEQEVVDEIQVGDTHTLQGVLVVILDLDDQLDHMYKLNNNEDGNWNYFIFDGDTAEQATALVGTEVTVDVVITEIDADKVLYDVVSGPTAAE